MKRGPVYTVLFAVAIGVGCAALLTAVSEITAERRAENERAEEVRNILDVLGIPTTVAEAGEVRRATNAEILARFDREVRRVELAGRPAYRTADAVAVPFDGKGLWGPIYGFVALDPDLETIRSVTFYKHNETPGLGGEIETPAFRDQFRGMEAPATDGRVDIDIQTISGATMTSQRVEAMLEWTLAEVRAAEVTDGG